MNKKVLVVLTLVVTVGIFTVFAVPVVAADPAGSVQGTEQTMNCWGRAIILGRLLLVQDETKVDALLAKAIENDRLTAEQTGKIKDYWSNHHAQFTKKFVFKGLMRIQDEAKLQQVLENAVTSGKIDQAQADKITEAWHKIHSR
jgi:hypothetical protein